MTETKNNNNGLKVIAGLLGVVLLGTIIYTVSLYQDKKQTTKALTEEKELVVEDLNNLKSEYDKAILESNATNEELVAARDNIAKYIDSVSSMKADIATLSRYRRQVSVLKNKTLDAMETLDKAIDPADWEAGRFFTKKALGEINELITILDQCTLGTTTTEPTVEAEVAYEENPETEVVETTSVASMELEMIKVFEKHADDKLQSAEQAIEQLVELSNSIGPSSNNDQDPNSLAAHQKAYLEKAKKLLEEGIKNLSGK